MGEFFAWTIAVLGWVGGGGIATYLKVTKDRQTRKLTEVEYLFDRYQNWIKELEKKIAIMDKKADKVQEQMETELQKCLDDRNKAELKHGQALAKIHVLEARIEVLEVAKGGNK